MKIFLMCGLFCLFAAGATSSDFANGGPLSRILLPESSSYYPFSRQEDKYSTISERGRGGGGLNVVSNRFGVDHKYNSVLIGEGDIHYYKIDGSNEYAAWSDGPTAREGTFFVPDEHRMRKPSSISDADNIFSQVDKSLTSEVEEEYNEVVGNETIEKTSVNNGKTIVEVSHRHFVGDKVAGDDWSVIIEGKTYKLNPDWIEAIRTNIKPHISKDSNTDEININSNKEIAVNVTDVSNTTISINDLRYIEKTDNLNDEKMIGVNSTSIGEHKIDGMVDIGELPEISTMDIKSVELKSIEDNEKTLSENEIRFEERLTFLIKNAIKSLLEINGSDLSDVGESISSIEVEEENSEKKMSMHHSKEEVNGSVVHTMVLEEERKDVLYDEENEKKDGFYYKLNEMRKFESDVVRLHNEYREGSRGVNGIKKESLNLGIQPLKWDLHLAMFVSDWLEYLSTEKLCTIEHSSNTMRSDIRGWEGVPIGENLYKFSTSRKIEEVDIAAAIASWYEEIYCYRYGTFQHPREEPGCQQCENITQEGCQLCVSSYVGHFTQLMWAESNYIGCAYKVCKDDTEYDSVVIGCEYGRAGNMVDKLPFNLDVAVKLGLTNQPDKCSVL